MIYATKYKEALWGSEKDHAKDRMKSNPNESKTIDCGKYRVFLENLRLYILRLAAQQAAAMLTAKTELEIRECWIRASQFEIAAKAVDEAIFPLISQSALSKKCEYHPMDETSKAPPWLTEKP